MGHGLPEGLRMGHGLPEGARKKTRPTAPSYATRRMTWNPDAVSTTPESSPFCNAKHASSNARSRSPRENGLSCPCFEDEGQSERSRAACASAAAASSAAATAVRTRAASAFASAAVFVMVSRRWLEGRRLPACLSRQWRTTILTDASADRVGFASADGVAFGPSHFRSPVVRFSLYHSPGCDRLSFQTQGASSFGLPGGGGAGAGAAADEKPPPSRSRSRRRH